MTISASFVAMVVTWLVGIELFSWVLIAIKSTCVSQEIRGPSGRPCVLSPCEGPQGAPTVETP